MSPLKLPAARMCLLPAFAAIVFAGILAYANSFHGALLLDDHATIERNPSIRELASWRVFASPATTGTAGRPIANLTFALDYALGGTAVPSYHAINLLVHVTTALLLAVIVRRVLLLPRQRDAFGCHAGWLAAGVGLLWVAHPLGTQTVTYISERTEAMAAAGELAVLYCLLRYATAPRRMWAVGGGLAAALAMASKETAVVTPILALSFDAAFLAGSVGAAWRARRRWYLAVALAWVLLGVLVAAARLGARGVGHGMSPWTYGIIECRALLTYLKLSLWPSPLVFDYGWPTGVGTGTAVLAVLAVIAGAAFCIVHAWRGHRLGWLGVMWLILLAPTSSLVPIADQPIAESRAYLPLALVLTAGVVIAYRLLGVRVVAAAGVAAAAMVMATHQRNTVYETESGPWRDVLARRPESPRALNTLGTLSRARNLSLAITLHERAIALRPNYAEAEANLAGDLLLAGRAQDAVAHLRTAEQMQPRLAGIETNLGKALLAAGDIPTAITELKAAIRRQPNDVEAHLNLARSLAAEGAPDRAFAEFQAAARLGPDFAPARVALGDALLRHGDISAAIGEFESALALDEGNPAAHTGLGVALAERGRADDAAAQLQAALRVNPNYIPAANLLRELERERARSR